MIVQPDFLTHWKTRKLINRLRQKEAPLYVLRIWALCQTSRRDSIPNDAETIAAICEYPGEPEKLHSALIECGYLDRAENGNHKVHECSDVNARLIHNWEAGVHGGRPKGSRKKTLGKPLGSPEKPSGSPIETDRLDRVDKIEKIDETDGGNSPADTRQRDVHRHEERNVHQGTGTGTGTERGTERVSVVDAQANAARALKLIADNEDIYKDLMHKYGLDPVADRVAVVGLLSLRPAHEWEKHGCKLLRFAVIDAASDAHRDRTNSNDGWKPASPNRKSLLPE